MKELLSRPVDGGIAYFLFRDSFKLINLISRGRRAFFELAQQNERKEIMCFFQMSFFSKDFSDL